MELKPYTNDEASSLLRDVVGILEAPENCDGLRMCLNHVARYVLELAAAEADEMDAAHVGGVLLAAAKRMTPNVVLSGARTGLDGA